MEEIKTISNETLIIINEKQKELDIVKTKVQECKDKVRKTKEEANNNIFLLENAKITEMVNNLIKIKNLASLPLQYKKNIKPLNDILFIGDRFDIYDDIKTNDIKINIYELMVVLFSKIHNINLDHKDIQECEKGCPDFRNSFFIQNPFNNERYLVKTINLIDEGDGETLYYAFWHNASRQKDLSLSFIQITYTQILNKDFNVLEKWGINVHQIFIINPSKEKRIEIYNANTGFLEQCPIFVKLILLFFFNNCKIITDFLTEKLQEVYKEEIKYYEKELSQTESEIIEMSKKIDNFKGDI